MSVPNKIVYDDGLIQIWHGDSRIVLPMILHNRGPQSVDLIYSDPPYGIKYQTAHRDRKHKLAKAILGDEDLSMLESVMPYMHELLANDRHWYLFASSRMIGPQWELCKPNPDRERIVDYEVVTARNGQSYLIPLSSMPDPWMGLGDGPRQVLCWDKGDAGTCGDLNAGFGEAWEAIIYGRKGRRNLRRPRPRTIVRVPWSASRDQVHPTAKAPALIQRLLYWSTWSRELVLDPFMGGGSAAEACKIMGRRFIGVEFEDQYVQAAVERLEKGVFDLDFDPDHGDISDVGDDTTVVASILEGFDL